MISTALAADLREAGLTWTPVSGDAFQIRGNDFEGDVFTVSDMTIEAHTYPSGTVLGFNGTTEWALDSVAIDDALWLPREDRASYVVTTRVLDVEARFASEDPAEAYGLALLALLRGLA